MTETIRTFDAELLARAWLAVLLASGKDDTLPALNRTVAVEEFAYGVRLVATDRYVMLWAWVPSVDHDLAAPPRLDEAPDRTVICSDPHDRAKGLMGYVLKRIAAARRDESAEVDKHQYMTLTLGVVEPEDDTPQQAFEGMLDREWAVLSYPNRERVRLVTVADEYPQWRLMAATFKPRRTGSVALNTEIVGRLAKLGSLLAGPLHWHFGGADKSARVEIGYSGHGASGNAETAASYVEGLVMPVRWGYAEDEPTETTEG